jgi:putative transposase
MNEMDLNSIYNRHKTRSLTDSSKARGNKYSNLVRGKSFTKAKTALCSDITYLKCEEGWLYYCIIKDIVTGQILGSATSRRMKKELVIQAFLNAQRRHRLPKGIIFHSDRGSQYTSNAFMELLKQQGIRQSFSRVGKPGDNAWAESFFATLKKERIHLYQFQTIEELEQVVFSWTEAFYNTERIQKRLGYLAPNDYEDLIEKEVKEKEEIGIKEISGPWARTNPLTTCPVKC